VHSSAELPLQTLLERQGVSVQQESADLAQRLGLRVTESAGVQVKSVLRGSAAEQAGFAAGDEWLALESGTGKQASSWRLSKLDDVPLYAGAASTIGALVARDKRILKLSLKLPAPARRCCLTVRDKKLVEQWLN
jgi:predicted metalloprotease with PDZ domain